MLIHGKLSNSRCSSRNFGNVLAALVHVPVLLQLADEKISGVIKFCRNLRLEENFITACVRLLLLLLSLRVKRVRYRAF